MSWRKDVEVDWIDDVQLHGLYRLDHACEIVVGDLKVEGSTDPLMAKDRKSDVFCGEGLYSVGSSSLFAVEENDVGFDGGWVDVEGVAGMNGSSKFTGTSVILFHEREVMVDGVVCSSG